MTDENPGDTGAEEPADDVVEQEVDTNTLDAEETQEEAQSFTAEYVRELRGESAKHRTRAKDAEARADDLAKRLHVELVRSTGRLADPNDLPFDPAHLEDADALTAAVDALLEAKPHYAPRKPTGDIGQGATSTPEPVSLSAMLRSRAG